MNFDQKFPTNVITCNWILILSQGDKGDPGPQGPAGPLGEKVRYTAKLLMQSLCRDWTTTMWCLSSHLLVALVEGYRTVYLCHLDSYTMTVCNGYLVSSHVVTVQLPTMCLVDRFLHRPYSSGYIITCVSDVVTVQ